MKNSPNFVEQNTPHKEQNTAGTKDSILSVASRNTIMHHLSSFLDNNVDAVVSDYTNESVLITEDGTYTGPAEIKVFFEGLLMHFPTQQSTFKLDKLVVINELAYIVWHAKTPTLEVPLGSDTFILKDGKISQQTFVGQLKFIN